MKVTTFDIEENVRFVKVTGKGAVETRPFVKVSLDGSGCSLPHCNCSPLHFISVSNGKMGISIELTKKEAKAILTGCANIYLA